MALAVERLLSFCCINICDFIRQAYFPFEYLILGTSIASASDAAFTVTIPDVEHNHRSLASIEIYCLVSVVYVYVCCFLKTVSD